MKNWFKDFRLVRILCFKCRKSVSGLRVCILITFSFIKKRFSAKVSELKIICVQSLVDLYLKVVRF